MKTPVSLVITFGTSGNFVTRDFVFDSMPTNAELQLKLTTVFGPFGLNPTKQPPVPQPCALLSPRKPYDCSKAHGTD
jgi:hypothetical protein